MSNLLDEISVYCVTTEKDAIGEVLERTDKRIKVVLKGTDITINLSRTDPRYAYVGYAHNMEFETFGELED